MNETTKSILTMEFGDQCLKKNLAKEQHILWMILSREFPRCLTSCDCKHCAVSGTSNKRWCCADWGKLPWHEGNFSQAWLNVHTFFWPEPLNDINVLDKSSITYALTSGAAACCCCKVIFLGSASLTLILILQFWRTVRVHGGVVLFLHRFYRY